MSSPNSSPGRSFRSRMGTVMRRTSSVLAMANSRPSTPTASTTPVAPSGDDSRRSSVSKNAEGRKSNTSLHQVAVPPESLPTTEPAIAPDATVDVFTSPPAVAGPAPPMADAPMPAAEQPVMPAAPAAETNGKASPGLKRLLPIAAQYQMYPSPISESPAREAAANDEEQSQRAKVVGPSPLANAAAFEDGAPSTPPDVSAPIIQPASEPDSVAAGDAELPEPAAPPVVSESTYVPPPLVLDSSNPGAFTDEPEDLVAPASDVALSESAPPMPEPAATVAPEAAYFDLVPPSALLRPIEDIATDSTALPTTDTQAEEWKRATNIEPFTPPVPYDAATSAPRDTLGLAEPAASPAISQPIPIPSPRTVPVLGDLETDDFEGRPDGWRGVEKSKTPDVQVDQDPFADPQEELRPEQDSVFLMPIAVVDVDDAQEINHDSPYIDKATLPVPLVPFPKDDLYGSIRSMPSARHSPNHDFFNGVLRGEGVDAGSSLRCLAHMYMPSEQRPLLSSQPSPSRHEHHHHKGYHATSTRVGGNEGDQTLHDLGWLVYSLPDGSGVYYVHPTLRVTTDADLRVAVVLGRVGRAVGYSVDGAGTGNRGRTELWLREISGVPGKTHGKKGKGKASRREDIAELGLARWWIDHSKREAVSDGVFNKEDHLDLEYRYWAYMQSHPAHAVVPFGVRREAMDILTWSWTDRLLPPQEQPLPPPFSPAECQELLGLLRTFDVPQNEAGIQNVVLTRIVSRIMLRVAHWRQYHLRPHKALPTDAWTNMAKQPRPQRSGWIRSAIDIIVSCILLGIPFLFYDKRAGGGFGLRDAEGARSIVQRNIIPVLLVGACTCLLAAILLSASITFLSLPGLEDILPARIATLVVAALATCSMASGLLALLRFKADLLAEREDAATGVTVLNPALLNREGMLVVSTRSIIMSLPLVFLVYAMLAFVAAVALYSVEGKLGQYPLARWSVLGLVGGICGILVMSALLLRR
ncbi:hypothetical protein MKEN_01177800 [Mycena kentingensis (nom. inval.)]|nr:hypothetical protein MKEN_01177800 [Mycena kentingensis (nom. inval.)]